MPAWKRLITCPLTIDERIPLITTIFSDRGEIEAASSLRGNDAQSFIDAIDQVFDSLTPPLQRKCLAMLCKLCSHLSLLPTSLQIPLCYDQSDPSLYSGGYADVWKGEHQGCSVAIKVLRVYSTSDFRKIKGRFCREAMMWKTFRHPNVLPLLGATMSNYKFAMTSEWMANGNISEFIVAHPDTDRLELLKDVVKGLIYLHDKAMIHGDLKGANILINRHGRACLADFGLLVMVSDNTNPTFSNSFTVGGTTRWMSPELLDPEQFGLKATLPTRKSDCYALGMVIYEVLSGNAPFATHGVVSVIHKVTAGRRPERPQGTEGAWFVDRLWDTLRLCWAHQPEGRPAIQDVLECLERVSRDRKPLPSVDENAANSSQAPLNEGCFDVGGNGAKSKFFPTNHIKLIEQADGPEPEPEPQAAPPPPSPSPPPVAREPSPEPQDQGTIAIALYDYDATEESEISFREGERIIEIEIVWDDWWRGKTADGSVGFFPANYIKLIEQADGPEPEPEPQDQGIVAITLYDYDAVEENEISFREGERIVEIETESDDWWRGKTADGSVGLFPTNYIKLIEQPDEPEPEPEPQAAPPPPSPSPPPVAREPSPEPQDQGTIAIALYDYDAAEENEISFREGEQIIEIEIVWDDWWQGKAADGSVGFFPANYVEVQQ